MQETAPPSEVDLAIAGNGAIGCAIALHFSERHPNARIALIGRKHRPAGASAAAGAMLNVFTELEPGALDYPIARAKFEIARAATKSWTPHLEMLRARLSRVDARARVPNVELGTYIVQCSSDDPAAKRFDAILDCMRSVGESFRDVDPRSIDGITTSAAVRAVYVEHEGRLDARALLVAYDELFATAANIHAVDDEVASISASRELRLSSGAAIQARLVVIAAGASSQDLIEGLELHEKIPRIVAGVGTAIVLDTSEQPHPSSVIRCIGSDAGVFGGLYALPHGDRHTYVGATTHIHTRGTAAPTEDAQTLRDAASRLLHPGLRDAKIHEVLFGWRPITLDTYPLLGRTSIEGIWIATGTRRDGLHLSPQIAEELVRCMTSPSGDQPFNGLFGPERSLLLEVPRAIAIERSVTHWRGPSSEKNGVLQHVLDIYRAAGFEDSTFGIPPELLHIYREGDG